jgi:hypothetical protein
MIGSKIETRSLKAQIRDTELQVLKHQQRVDVHSIILIQKIRQQMTAPATLLLAVGIGFISGELTKRQTPKLRGAAEADNSREAKTTPLSTALNFITLAHTLYSALPMPLKMRYFHQPDASAQYRPLTAHKINSACMCDTVQTAAGIAAKVSSRS